MILPESQREKDDFEKLFPIFTDVIKNPSFPQVEVEKRKQRWVAELEQDRESPRRVIRNYFKILESVGQFCFPTLVL